MIKVQSLFIFFNQSEIIATGPKVMPFFIFYNFKWHEKSTSLEIISTGMKDSHFRVVVTNNTMRKKLICTAVVNLKLL